MGHRIFISTPSKHVLSAAIAVHRRILPRVFRVKQGLRSATVDLATTQGPEQ